MSGDTLFAHIFSLCLSCFKTIGLFIPLDPISSVFRSLTLPMARAYMIGNERERVRGKSLTITLFQLTGYYSSHAFFQLPQQNSFHYSLPSSASMTDFYRSYQEKPLTLTC